MAIACRYFLVQRTRHDISYFGGAAFAFSNNSVFVPRHHTSISSSTTTASKTRGLQLSKRHDASSLLSHSTNISKEDATADADPNLKRIVLIGGGHAHLQVIKAFNAKSRPKNWHVTLIDQSNLASYSGMIPGCISNQYTKQEAQIPLDVLAKWAKIEFHRDKMVGIDADAQRIFLESDCKFDNKAPLLSSSSSSSSSSWIEYDVLSLDIGSASRGLDTPGVSEFAIPTRPIDLLVDRIQWASEQIMMGDDVKVVVVGGGAAGIELALGMRERFGKLTLVDELQVTILDSGLELLSYESDACRSALVDVLKARDIKVKFGCRVTRIDNEYILLDDGRKIAYTHCIWAAGASAHALSKEIQMAGVSVDGNGWIEVGPTLQSVSHRNIFAAGDCATIKGLKDAKYGNERASPPKAGVYAVRSGPILIENISRYFLEQEMDEYDPQDDFLKLINCGDGTALGFRFGLPLRGKWVWELKDTIDQMFMDLFREDNLLDLSKEEDTKRDYAAAQYDKHTRDSKRPSPEEGCQLILRGDENVDFQNAWGVLREMMSDEEYKNEVLSFANKQL